MGRTGLVKYGILIEVFLIILMLVVRCVSGGAGQKSGEDRDAVSFSAAEGSDYIKWVDFNVSCEALTLAYEKDLETYRTKQHIDWIRLLALGAAQNGGECGQGMLADMEAAAGRIMAGSSTMEQETDGLAGYDYYLEAYQAVLGGMVGEFLVREENESGGQVWKRKYGLKAFSPIAKGFPYSDYDDFGAARNYGYSRPHLGHDMEGQIGTPVIAIESGRIEVLGWNRYGGWRIGLRSFDGKRYYYYAHLRQDYPYAEGLEEGDLVTAGDVIGYMGHTGYSVTENVNNIRTVHLHWGLELIFDESQKESDNEIWIDCYQLSRFLSRNRAQVEKKEGTREWKRVYDMRDPAVERLKNQDAGGNAGVSQAGRKESKIRQEYNCLFAPCPL